MNVLSESQTVEITAPLSHVWPQILISLLVVIPTLAALFALLDSIDGESEGETLAYILGWPKFLAGCVIVAGAGCFWLSRVTDFTDLPGPSSGPGVAVVSSPLMLPKGARAAVLDAYARGPEELDALAHSRGWKIQTRVTNESRAVFDGSIGRLK